MAWQAPMTAVAGSVFTAAQFNSFVRDLFLETAPAKATAAGRIMATNGVNSIVERVPSTHEISTAETFTSSTFGDLATPGPIVTVTTGTRAMVWWGAALSNDTVLGHSVMGITVSGATTIAASDTDSVNFEQGPDAGSINQSSQMLFGKLYTNLTAGSNVFTAKYRTVSGTGTSTFSRRRIIVLPL